MIRVRVKVRWEGDEPRTVWEDGQPSGDTFAIDYQAGPRWRQLQGILRYRSCS